MSWLFNRYNIIKWLNKFMIVIIMNIHRPWLGYYSWCFLMSGWKCYWVFLHNQFFTFWCCSLTSPLYVASMFGAFTSSSPIGCICHSSCYCAYSWTCWCLSCSNCFLRLLITTLEFFLNQQVLRKPLHYFLTIDLFFRLTPHNSQKFVFYFFYRLGAYLSSKTLH